jgi:hypothetical protein
MLVVPLRSWPGSLNRRRSRSRTGSPKVDRSHALKTLGKATCRLSLLFSHFFVPFYFDIGSAGIPLAGLGWSWVSPGSGGPVSRVSLSGLPRKRQIPPVDPKPLGVAWRASVFLTGRRSARLKGLRNGALVDASVMRLSQKYQCHSGLDQPGLAAGGGANCVVVGINGKLHWQRTNVKDLAQAAADGNGPLLPWL